MAVLDSKAQIQELHFEHTLWLKELDFFEGELKFFENRLSDLVMRYRSVEVLARLEQFQNQFIRQKEVLDKLSRDIRVHEQRISLHLQDGRDSTMAPLDDHSEMRVRMSDFRKIYAELKEKFFLFLTKWN